MTTCPCGTVYKPDSFWLRFGNRVVTCPKCWATGDAPREREERKGPAIQDDTLTGGARWVENMGHKPIWIETKSEFKRELERRGLELKDAGTHVREDKSPWATRYRRK